MIRIRTVAALTLILAAHAAAQATVPGWTMTTRTTIDSANGSPPFTMTMKITGSGKRARQEMSMRNMPPMASIMNAEDSTITVVMEQLGMAVISGSGIAQARLPKMSVTNLKSQRSEIGNETLDGRPAKHARVAMTATHTQTLNGRTCSKPEANEMEIWTVRDTVLPAIMKAFSGMTRSMLGNLTGTENIGPPDGAVPTGEAGVKMVARRVNTVSGKPITITTEYLDYRFLDVDPAALAVPAGFNVQDMRSMDMNAMVGGSLSERAEQMFWSQFDTTAAAGSQRATCTGQGSTGAPAQQSPAPQSRRSDPPIGQPWFAFQVDEPVRERADTKRPAYPRALMNPPVQGTVTAQFVVDTLGLVEIATFKVLKSDHSLFEQAVREVLPDMRFVPAVARKAKVRQLVQQPFEFRIMIDTTRRKPR